MYVAAELNGGHPIQGTFQATIDWLYANHWIPPNAKTRVDHIRTMGNEATHEITVSDPDLARQLVGFLAMMLRFIYEMPSMATTPPAGSSTT